MNLATYLILFMTHYTSLYPFLLLFSWLALSPIKECPLRESHYLLALPGSRASIEIEAGKKRVITVPGHECAKCQNKARQRCRPKIVMMRVNGQR
jgi:hypothetical protein